MFVNEIKVKQILSKSKVYPYTINPYVGCQHGCTYCYARFMKRFTGHREPWGQFVDVKINAPELLEKEITKKIPQKVWISGVCDPYQPLEGKYKITRKCLKILIENKWPVVIQTKSPLVLRDIDILKKAKDIQIGFSIATADDNIRKMFEPNAHPINLRIEALKRLHKAGLKTYAMIAPILPGAEKLPDLLVGKIDYVIMDRMNYNHADWVYEKYGLQDKMTDNYFIEIQRVLNFSFAKLGIG
jgi:DNA repair photolyase